MPSDVHRKKVDAIPWHILGKRIPFMSGSVHAPLPIHSSLHTTRYKRGFSIFAYAPHYIFMKDTQMHVIVGVEIPALSALLGPFLDAMLVFVSSSATVPPASTSPG